MSIALFIQIILTFLLLFSAFGTILSKKPVHCCLYFLLALLSLSALFAELSAEFMAVMQILIYAGAILVIFMFVMVLFQDAHAKILQTSGLSSPQLLILAATAFVAGLAILATRIGLYSSTSSQLLTNFGSVQSLGTLLYVDFFFPFEATLLLFLIACVGTVYIGKRES